MKYQKRQMDVKAIRWTGTNFSEAQEFTGNRLSYDPIREVAYLKTKSGELNLRIGDWIFKGVDGEFYPGIDKAFEITYQNLTENPEKVNTDFFEVSVTLPNMKVLNYSLRKSAVRSVTTVEDGSPNITTIIMDHHAKGEYELCMEPREEVLRRLM